MVKEARALAERQLAKQMRSERHRLGLSSARVADICGVTETTVLNWEKERARIPLAAAAFLWPYGFDTEALLAGKFEMVKLLEYPPLSPSPAHFVPKHLLRRNLVPEGKGFVFCNQRHDEEFLDLGKACVVEQRDSTPGDLLEIAGFCLFRLLDTDDLFLCRAEKRAGNRLVLSVGGQSVETSAKKLIAVCQLLGRCAFWLPKDIALSKKKKSNSDILRDAISLLSKKAG